MYMVRLTKWNPRRTRCRHSLSISPVTGLKICKTPFYGAKGADLEKNLSFAETRKWPPGGTEYLWGTRQGGGTQPGGVFRALSPSPAPITASSA